MTPKGKSFLRRLLDRAQSRGESLAGMTKSTSTSTSTSTTSTKEISPDSAKKNDQTDQGDDENLVKE